MARTTPVTVDLLHTERVRTMIGLLAEILDQYDRQMADEPWRLSRGVGYAEVQIDTATGEAIRAALGAPSSDQDTPCAKCGDLGDVYSVDASPRGVIGRVPCPSCAPTESDPT